MKLQRSTLAHSYKKLKQPSVAIPLVCVVVITILSVVLSLQHTKTVRAQQQRALAALSQQQKKQSHKSAQTVSTKSDVSDAPFTDLSTASAAKSNCARLQNRPGVVITDAGCNYKLRAFGDMRVAIVFVNENDYAQSTYNALKSNDASSPQSLAYANTYYAQQAARYKVSNPMHLDFTYFGPYKVTDSVIYKEYANDSGSLIQTFQNTAKVNNVPQGDYDMVEYVLLDSVYGGVAFPSQHQAYAYSQYEPSTFIHETLHLFGATDKYTSHQDPTCKSDAKSDPFNRYGGNVAGNDIMCQNFDLNTSVINDITAREIGWAN